MLKITHKSLFIFIIFWLVFSSSTTAQDKSVVGEWSDPIALDVLPVAVSNLPNGKLIVWSASERDFFYPNDGPFGPTDGFTYTELFDPFLGQDGQGLGEDVTNLQHDMFCPGINNLPNGNILSAGGTSNFKTSIYDYKNNTWIADADMNIKRAYQGNVTLSNGDIFTWGGSWSEPIGVATSDKNAEVWNPITGWTEIPGLDGDMLFNAQDLATEPDGVYRADNHAWLWPAPNGELFHAGPGETMHWVDITAGTAVSAGTRNGDTNSMKGTTVMFDTGKLLKIGGAENYADGAPAKNNSLIIDINGAYGVTPTVTNGGNLNFSRTMHNSTVLPNGDVMVTGGLDNAATFSDYGARLTAEIFTEGSGWRNVAGMAVPRTYHSVSILLPDGRVFAGGGGLCVGCFNHYDAEIYSPPYLFESDGSYAERPFINAPETANYNTTINVTGSTGITEMSLIRFSAATHSTNNEQRRIPITTIVDNGANYDITIPGSNLLPPGYYMLFAIDANGVPSIAETIQIADNTITSVNPCDGTSLVPQLSISGTPSIGDDFILLTGGENLTALTATGPGTKTITLPNGTVVTDNYAIGTMDATKEGWYTIENNLGCFTRVKIALETPDIPLCTTTTNLALGKFAEQSSNYQDVGFASYAVDGDLNGTDQYVDLQHTNPELSPWWQVDLEAMANIEEVIIYNRQSADPAVLDRLADFYVFTSDLPFSKTATLQEIFTDPNVENHYYGGTVNGSATITIDEEARYLRVQFLSDGLNANRILHMAELEVIGCISDPCAVTATIDTNGPFLPTDGIVNLQASPVGGKWGGDAISNGTFDASQGLGTYTLAYSYTDGTGCTQSISKEIKVSKCSTTENLALNKPAAQSSTYFSGIASLANDGNTTGTTATGFPSDLQHTNPNEGNQPWWEVDLETMANIEEVVIYNRSDVQQGRLNNFYVFTSAVPFSATASADDLLNDANVQSSLFSGPAGLQENIAFEAEARYVRIQLTNTNNGILHLAEIEVIGCAITCDTALNLGNSGPFIENTGIETLTANIPGGTWYGDINAATGEFDTNIPKGLYTITYVVTDGNGCIQSESVTIEVALCIGVENLALGKETKQSSTENEGGSYLAVDGNTQGTEKSQIEFADLQHTITSTEEHWWEVDLGGIATIQSIEIFNRFSTDTGILDRLSNFSIFVSVFPFSESVTYAQLNADPNVDNLYYPGNLGISENIDFETKGRYVRIHFAPGGNRTLHMSEVRVFGCLQTCATTANITSPEEYLDTDGATNLTASPLGGTWGGAATATGLFNPSTLGVGLYKVAYYYTDGDGCEQTVEKDIRVTKCTSATNLALNKFAEQDVTYGDGAASLAVDGNTSGNSAFNPGADLQHTGAKIGITETEAPWWQVDLGLLADIDEVIIYNRNGTQFQKDLLNYFYVFTSETPFNPAATLTDLLNDVNIGKEYFKGAAGDVERINIAKRARYVRIQLNTGNGDKPPRIIHMSEVQVIGCEVVCAENAILVSPNQYLDTDGPLALQATPVGGTWSGATVDGNFDPSALGIGDYIVTYTVTDGDGCTQIKDFNIKVSKCTTSENLALNKPTNQSSTYNQGLASYAVDGDTFGDNASEFLPGSPANLQHTGTAPADQNQPWWEVNLEALSNIEEVVIFNRSPAPQTRLQNFYVHTSTTPFIVGATLDDLLNDPNVINTYFTGVAGESESIIINEEGQYVRVQLSGTTNAILHMAEVQVFGCSPSDPCTGETIAVINPAGPFLTTDTVQNLVATPAGGTWGGDSTDGTFDPSVLGEGTYNVTYTTDNGAGCVQTTNIDIIVNDACAGETAPVIDPAGPFLTTDTVQNLAVTPLGGTWGGDSTDGTFDPSVLGEGTYNVTYTTDNGAGCVQTTNIDIIVNDACAGETAPVIDPAGPFLTTDTVQNLVATPLGGTWGGDSTDGTFDPSVLGEGTYNVTYTTDNGAGCVQTTNIDIIVNDACAGETAPVIDPAGPFLTTDTVQNLVATPAGGTWGGDSTDGTFDPSVLGEGTYNVTYTTDNGAGCVQTTNIDIIVNDACAGETAPVIDPAGPFLTTDTVQNLVATPLGGTWGGDSTDGTFDPSVLGEGTYNVTYTTDDGAGCVQTTNIDIIVNDACAGETAPVIDPAGPFLTTDTVQNLVATPAGGTWGGDSTDGTFDPSVLGEGTYNVTYTTDNGAGCVQTTNIDIIVNDACAGETAPVIDPAGPFLTTDTVQNLVATPLGGTWGGDSTDGTFDPSVLGEGTYNVTYTTDNGAGCVQTTNIDIIVNDACAGETAPVIDPAGPFLTTDTVQNLVATPAGGTWGGDSTDGTFDPSVLGEGTYNVTYTTDNGAGCVQTTNIDIIVNDACAGETAPVIDPAGPFLTTDTVQNLVATPLGGTWGGDSTDGTFDPSVLGEGTYNVTYTTDDGAGCVQTTNIDIIVNDACAGETAPVIDPAGPFLTTDTVQNLVATPAGGTWGGDSTDGTFDPSVIGEGTYNVTYTTDNGAGCVQTTNIDIIVNDACAGETAPVIDPAGPFLTTDTVQNLVATPAGGTWGGDSTDGTFDPSVLGEGTYNVTYTTDNGAGCVQTTNIDIIVNDACAGETAPVIDPAGPFLTTDTVQNLVATPLGGTWGGDSTDGTFDPSVLGEGTYNVTYTTDNGAGCVQTTNIDIIVNDACAGETAPVIDPAGPFLTTDTVQNLVATPLGGTWGGDSTDGTFDPSVLGEGTYNVTYTTDNGAGCVQTTNIDIIVNDACAGETAPVIDPAGPFLTTDTVQNLVATPLGGTWGGDSTDGTFDPSVLGEGTYNVTYTTDNGAGCVQTTNIDIIVNDACAGETAPVIDPAGPFLTTDTVQNLVATPLGGTWGGDSTDGTFDPSVLGEGTYNVTYTTDNGAGCVQTTNIDIIVTEDNESLNNSDEFEIYPVPNEGLLNITLENYLGKIVQVKIFNDAGQVVFKRVFDENHNNIEVMNLNHVADGKYHLLFDSPGVVTSKSFIIIKK